jgi:hypothetical protein
MAPMEGSHTKRVLPYHERWSQVGGFLIGMSWERSANLPLAPEALRAAAPPCHSLTGGDDGGLIIPPVGYDLSRDRWLAEITASILRDQSQSLANSQR